MVKFKSLPKCWQAIHDRYEAFLRRSKTFISIGAEFGRTVPVKTAHLTVDLKIFWWERFLVVSSKKGTTSLAITKNASNIIGGESDVVVYTFEMRLDTLEYFIL